MDQTPEFAEGLVPLAEERLIQSFQSDFPDPDIAALDMETITQINNYDWAALYTYNGKKFIRFQGYDYFGRENTYEIELNKAFANFVFKGVDW